MNENEVFNDVWNKLNNGADAWELAKENGYEGTKEEFEALCAKAAEELKTEKMDMDSLDAVAGGGTWDDVKTFFNDHKEIILGVTGAVGAGVIGVLSYKLYSGRNTGTEGPSILGGGGLNDGFMQV